MRNPSFPLFGRGTYAKVLNGIYPYGSNLIKKALDHYNSSKSSLQAPRLFITPRMMRILAQKWHSGSSKERCVLACDLAACMGQMRLGELFPQSVALLEREKLPRWHHFSVSLSNLSNSTLKLPWTKTTFWKGHTVNFSAQSPPIQRYRCPSGPQACIQGSQLEPNM